MSFGLNSLNKEWKASFGDKVQIMFCVLKVKTI